MKKILAIIFGIVLVFGLTACRSESAANDTQTKRSVGRGSEYAGVWMANVKASVTAEEVEYETYVIKLNADGTGSYRDKPGIWACDDDGSSVVLTLKNEGIGIVLEVGEVDGLVVLKYFRNVYYREEDLTQHATCSNGMGQKNLVP